MLVERIAIRCTRANLYERLDHPRRPSNSPHLVHDDSHVGVSVSRLSLPTFADAAAHVLERDDDGACVAATEAVYH